MKLKAFTISMLEAEEQPRTDLLMWQERFIDYFPQEYDIGLDNRKLDYGSGNVVTIARNGKELFYIDTSRASVNGGLASIRIYGEHVDTYTIQAAVYEREFKILLYLYDIARKLRNLNGEKADVRVGRKNVDTFTISLVIKGQGGFGDYLIVEYKPNVSTFYVKLERSLSNKEQLATTKDDSKIVDLVDRLFKERVVNG